MGGGQSQDSSTATATRNSSDQRAGRDVSSRKSGNIPTTSSQSQSDPSQRRVFLGVNDSRRRGEGGGGGLKLTSRREDRESDELPSIQHQSLSQPSSHTNSGNHHSLHTHTHSHHHHQQRMHHRQRLRPPDTLPPLDIELSVPHLLSQPVVHVPANESPSEESLRPELELVFPTSSTRHRTYYEGGSGRDMELDLSMTALSRRLRAAGLITEESGGGGGAGGGISNGVNGGSLASSRRNRRPRRHHAHSSHGSRNRQHMGTTIPPSSVVLVRGLAAKMTCPLCSKEFSAADLEEHLLTCMTKPRIRYNVDSLQQDSGECTICLEDMLTGDQIARLPCLCIYHLKCLKQWYKVNPTCPEHPDFVVQTAE